MGLKSIITDDMTHCYICGAPYPQIHHCMNGANKTKSEWYGLLLPLCMNHHTGDNGVHTHPDKMLEVRRIAQKKFEERYSRELWIKEFGKNYL